MTPKELKEKRMTLINNARAILEKSDTEKREPTAEERSQYDVVMTEVKDLKVQIDMLEGDLKRRSDLDSLEAEMRDTNTTSKTKTTDIPNKPADSQRQAEAKFFELRKSADGCSRNVALTGNRATPEYNESFRSYLANGMHMEPNEMRALQKDSDTAGGYLSAPLQFIAQLIKNVDNQVFMRQRATVLPPITSAESVGAPSLDNDIADPTWTAEILTGDEDSTLSFGKRELTPHPVAQLIKLSKTLVRRSTLSAESIVNSRLAYKLGIVAENAYLNGSGVNQPLGVFVASDNGISTDRDFSTDNTTTAMTFNGLKRAKYGLKAQYWPNASWCFHRDGQLQLATIKDGEGRYVWQPSVVPGEPDRLLNFPIDLSEYAPNTFTTGLYVGILGDFTKYWIVDALTLTIQVLTELYAATNQNGYISRFESDGMPVVEEAFSRVKLG